MADMPTSGKESSFLKQIIIMQRIEKMNDAKADGNTARYFIIWKLIVQLVMPHMRFEQRKRLQDEFTQLMQIEKQIQELPETEENFNAACALATSENPAPVGWMNKATKADEILKLRYTFSDNREFYIFDTLPKLGLGMDYEEGVIDFSKYDIDAIARAVQDIDKGAIAAVNAHIAPSKESGTPELELEQDDTVSQLE